MPEVGGYMGLCWVLMVLLSPDRSWLGVSLYWWRASGLAEGLEGMAGRGEPMADLGERGGTFMLPPGAWGPEGMTKLPWSEEVEEDRERWGEASILPRGGPAMCTGEVTGEGDMEAVVW